MITKLVLENWKSFEKATLNIDPLTVLIGTNASGKSNALDALAFIKRIASGISPTAALRGDVGLPAIRGGLDWAVRKPLTEFSLTIVYRDCPKEDYEYHLVCRVDNSHCEITHYTVEIINFDMDEDDERLPHAGQREGYGSNHNEWISAGSFEEYSPYDVERKISSSKNWNKLRDIIFILDPIPSHMRGYSSLSDTLESDASNIAGVIAALPEEKQREIEKTLTHYVSLLPEKDVRRVYAERVGKFATDAMLYCEEHWYGEEISTVDARGMSDGTLRFLAILTAILTRPKGSLLVIEEVDNGLHPSRASLMLNVLKTVGSQRGVDVLVTTHNPALLDAMGTEMVPFITVAHRDPTSGVSVLTLLEDIQQLPKLLAHGRVGQLATEGLIEKTLDQNTAGE